jgi:hypothetical protein
VAAMVMGMPPWLAEGRHRGSAAAAPARARRDRMTGLRVAVDKVADAQDAFGVGVHHELAVIGPRTLCDMAADS